MKKFYDEHIGDAIKKYFSKGNNKLSDKYIENKIKEILKREMGEMLSGYTTAINFKNGCIYMKISSASLKNELINGQDQLIKMINTELEQRWVNKVVVQ